MTFTTSGLCHWVFAGDTKQRVRDQVPACFKTVNNDSFLSDSIEIGEIDGAGIA